MLPCKIHWPRQGCHHWTKEEAASRTSPIPYPTQTRIASALKTQLNAWDQSFLNHIYPKGRRVEGMGFLSVQGLTTFLGTGVDWEQEVDRAASIDTPVTRL